MPKRAPKLPTPTLGTSTPEQVVKSVVELRDWYVRRAAGHRRWFRASGVATIVLSATLPLLAGLSFDGDKALIAVIGVAIAILAGLRNFYKWDQLWGVLRQSGFELTNLIDRWTLERDLLDPSVPADTKKLNEITLKLIKAADEVRKRESSSYFSGLQFPPSGSS